MIDISVKVDDEDFSKAMADLRHIEEGIETATIRAINRTVDGVKTDLSTLARERYNVKAKVIAARIKLTKATKAKMSGEVRSTGKPIPLYEFGPKPATPQPSRRPKITVEVLKGQRKTVGGGAFVAFMKSGHKAIWWRASKIGTDSKMLPPLSQYKLTKSGKVVRRLGIHELSGPRLENLYASELTDNGRLQKSADERMKKNFEHNVDYLFRKKNEMV